MSTVATQLLSVQVASNDALDVRHFQIIERMSSLFDISIVALSDNPDIDFEAVVGQPMSFTLTAGAVPQSRTWNGVCCHLQQTAVEDRGLSTYALTLVPALWLATQRRNHRMFQLKSELDIVLEVLGDWNISPVLKLSGVYKKRKYRVQYGESDYAFICRMLEDAGVAFYFECDEGETKLVLHDAPQVNDPRPPIAFRDKPSDADREHVTRLGIERRIRPGKYTVRDVDYRIDPTYKLVASVGNASGVEERLERFHYVPGAFLFEAGRGEATPSADDKGKYRTDETEGQSLAQRRLEAKRAIAKTVSFETNTVDPAPGIVMSFVDHPRSDLAAGKRFLVIESTWTGAANEDWIHKCRAVSAAIPYRPPLATPKPKTNGVESATVVGAAGEEIHTDEFGRVRVHFHWDRESKMNDHSSCWIPVSQPWGGAGYGGSNLPRVGQEVIVDFLSGDPDRPVIVGRVYTNLQKTPYKLPDNKTQSGLKSNSTGKTGGYNEIMFEDSAGNELLRMQAERDLNKLVKHDEQVQIGNDRTKQIGRDDSHDVGRDRQRTVGRDEHVEVGQDRGRSVGRDEDIQIGRDHAEQIGQDFMQQVGRNQDVMVQQDLAKDVGQNERETTGQNRSITVGQNRSSDVGLVDSSSIGEMYYLEIKPPDTGEGGGGGGGGPTNVTIIDKKLVFTTGAGATLTMDGAEVRIEADVIKFLAKTNIVADAEAADVDVHAKTDIVLRSDQTIHVSTKAGVIDASATGGDVALKSDKNVTANAGADISGTAATNVTLSGKNASISASTQASVHAPTTLVTGTSNVTIAGSAAKVDGGNTEVLGSSQVLVKGAVVLINP